MAGPEGEPFSDNVGAWGVRQNLVVVIANTAPAAFIRSSVGR